jgi:O-antigen ligase
MGITQFLWFSSHKKYIPMIGLFPFIASCRQWAIDPQVELGLILITAIVSFIVMFIKPIFGIYSVLVIAIYFDPKIHIGFANLYLHQWIILIALMASISSSLLLENLLPKIESEMNFPFILFIGSILLSLSHAPNFKDGLRWFFYVGVFFGSYYLFLLSITEKKQLEIFIDILIFSTFVVCIISLIQKGSGRLGSLVLWNPNAFGNFLALVIPFCSSFVLYGEIPQRKRSLFMLALIPMFICLGLTFSRSAWVGIFTGFFLLSVIRHKFSLAIFFCFFTAIALLVTPIQKRVFEDINDPGAQYRKIKAEIAIEKFKAHPIMGNGLASFHHEAQYSNIWAYHAHSSLENNYLLMLAEGGIIEFAAFLFFMFSFLKMAFKSMRKLNNGYMHCVVLGSIASFISTLGAGMFEGTLYNPQFNWLTGMLMAGTVVVIKLHTEECNRQKDLSPPDSLDA